MSHSDSQKSLFASALQFLIIVVSVLSVVGLLLFVPMFFLAKGLGGAGPGGRATPFTFGEFLFLAMVIGYFPALAAR